MAHHAHEPAWYEKGSAALLWGIMVFFLAADVSRWIRSRRAFDTHKTDVEHVLDVEGMTCGGCVRKARGALEAVHGVSHAEVVLTPGTARVTGSVQVDDLIAALSSEGFTARRNTSD